MYSFHFVIIISRNFDSKHIKVDNNQQKQIEKIEKRKLPAFCFLHVSHSMALCSVPPGFAMPPHWCDSNAYYRGSFTIEILALTLV